MNKELKSKDEIALDAFEKTRYDRAKKAAEESEKEGLIIYVNFKTKKVTGYGKV